MKGKRRAGPSAAWSRSDAIWASTLKWAEKFVLIAILDTDRLARGVKMWPSLESRAQMTSLSYPTVRRAVASLKRKGVLACVGHVAAALAGGKPRGRIAMWRFRKKNLPMPRKRKPSNRRSQRAVVAFPTGDHMTLDSRSKNGDSRSGNPRQPLTVSSDRRRSLENGSERGGARARDEKATTKKGSAAGRVPPVPGKYSQVMRPAL